jgi:uncharacterized repeat protein (TIGR01451 family)
MADLGLVDCFQPELVKLERVHYFPRQLLTADDMIADQDYFRQKLRRHNRFLHGWGVVCGLEVTAEPSANTPWRVKISDGYALGPYGDEIFVAEPVYLDLAECGPGAATSPCEPSLLLTHVSATGGQVFVAIKYAECLAQPVRAMPAGCACEDEACEYSRIRDSFQIECLTELPPLPPATLICDLINGQQLPHCPPCPTDPWVFLARVTLPASPSTNVASIDNFVRRQLYSTTLLQEQLIACCCEERPQPTLQADVEIAMVATEPLGGGRIRYTITVTNNGPSTAQNVIVEDKPPDGILEAVGFTGDGNWTQIWPNQPFRAELGDLADSDVATLGFEVSFNLDSGGTFINSASVKTDTPDPNLSNNTATTTTLVPGTPK